MTMTPLAKMTLAAVLAATLLAGCGRKGGLERPSAAMQDSSVAGSTGPAAPPPAKDRRFILDGLLE